MTNNTPNICDLKAVLRAALFDDKPAQAICTGGRADVGVLPALQVEGVGDISLAVSETTCRDISCHGNQESAGAVKLGSRLVRTSACWVDALTRVSQKHLRTMGLIGMPVGLSLVQLIMVRPGQSYTWRCGQPQTTSAPNSSFASVLVQIPVQSGLGGILNITHDSNHSEFCFGENSETDFFALTCLSSSQVTISNPSDKRDSVYLHYYVDCKDNGPVPSLDTRKDSRWLLKRAAFLWKNLFEAVPDGDDATPVPVKLAFCVDGFESYGEVELKDKKVVEKLEASGEFTSYLTLTSKTASGLRDAQWAASDSNRSVTSQFRVARWAPLGQHRDAKLDNLGISDLDNLRGDGKPTSDTWTRKMMLVFWPRAHSRLIDLAGSQPQNMEMVINTTAMYSSMDVLLNLWHCERPNPSKILPQLNHVTELGRLSRMLALFIPAKHHPDLYVYGLLSDVHVKTFFTIIKRFGYESVKKHVMPVLQITKPGHLANVIELGQSLVSYHREHPSRVDSALLDIAQLARECVSDEYNPDPIVVTTLTKFLFTAPGVGAVQSKFATRMMIYDHLNKHIPIMMNVITKLDFKNANESTRHNVLGLARSLMLFPGASKDDFKSTMLYVMAKFPWDEDLQSNMRYVIDPENALVDDLIGTMERMIEGTVELLNSSTEQAGIEMAQFLMEQTAELQNVDNRVANLFSYHIGKLLLKLGSIDPVTETATGMVNSLGIQGLRGMLMSMLKQETQTSTDDETQEDTSSEKQSLISHSLVPKLVERFLGKGVPALNDTESMDERLELIQNLWFLLLSEPEMQDMQGTFVGNLVQDNNQEVYDALLINRFFPFSKNPHVVRIAAARAKQLDRPPPKYRVKSVKKKYKADQRQLRQLLRAFPLSQLDSTSTPKPGARPRASVSSGTGSTSGAAPEVIVIDSDSDRLPVLDENDDEIEVVEQVKPSAQVQVEAAADRVLGDDEDIAMVGVTKQTVEPLRDYSHSRQHCSVFQWEPLSNNNIQHCAKCFCFVCEKPAKDCGSWSEHCHADEKDKTWMNLKRKRTGFTRTPERRSNRTTRYNAFMGDRPRKRQRSGDRSRRRR